jgi:hypothetical protein
MIGLFAVGAVFAFVVGYGWTQLAVEGGPFLSPIVGLAAAVVGLGLAYYVAAVKHENGKWAVSALLPFIILFTVSALGTLNTLFLRFQGQQALLDDAIAGRNQVVLLRAALERVPPAEERFRLKVRELWGNLKEEIINPSRCGQGPVAASKLKELQVILPSFQLRSGLDCLNAESTIPYYERRIQELVETSAEAMQSKPSAKTREALTAKAQNIEEEFKVIEKEAGPGLGVDEQRLVKKRLSEAASEYAALRRESEAVSPGAWGNLPMKLDVGSTNIGMIGKVLELMWYRRSDPTTYLFFLVALILDLAIVSAFGGVLKRGPRAYKVRPASEPEAL